MEIISREEAREKGLKRYFTGEPCKHGHVDERFVGKGNCVECRRQERARYYQKNRERIIAKAGKYYNENKEKVCARRSEFVRENKEYVKQKRKEQKEKHRDKINRRNRERYRDDPIFKVSMAMRRHLNKILNRVGKVKRKRTYEYCDYTPEEMHSHISSLLLEGMSWENYGEWHIDHKKPVAQFLREGITSPLIINSLANLYPMWADDNLSKKDKTLDEWLTEKGEDSEEYRKYSKFL